MILYKTFFCARSVGSYPASNKITGEQCVKKGFWGWAGVGPSSLGALSCDLALTIKIVGLVGEVHPPGRRARVQGTPCCPRSSWEVRASHSSLHPKGQPQVSGTGSGLPFFRLFSSWECPQSLGELGETWIAEPHPQGFRMGNGILPVEPKNLPVVRVPRWCWRCSFKDHTFWSFQFLKLQPMVGQGAG